GKGIINGLETLRGGITALNAGVGTAFTYLLTKERRSVRELLVPLLLIAVVVSVVVAGFVLAATLRTGWSPIAVVYAATVPASVVLAWQSGIYLGLNRIARLNSQTLALSIACLAVVAVSGYVLHSGPFVALVAWSLAIDVAALVMLVQVVPLGLGHGGGPLVDRASAAGLIGLGLKFGLYGVAGFLVYRLDSLLVAALLGATSFGIYSLAVSAGELLFMISRSVAAAAAHRIGSSEPGDSASTTALAIRISTPAVALGAVGAYFAVAPLVHVLYGEAFDPAIAPVRILLPGIVAYASAGIFSQYLSLQMGRPIFMLLWNLVLLVLQGGACLYLIPRMGLAGAALASTIAYVLSAIASTWYFSAVTAVPVSEIWMPRASDLSLAARAIADFAGLSRRGPTE
ncbi:MAG TPA: polysaccharide biosynthesis C-terminal domain-containing protein, partial [Candidatus Eremiobacteraceae bacterium]|nr:polysaccharide biosynthesis C-terminal domain-containing protein [Candidatus Eremiobacteraceae bacterium]